jgi:ABC-type Fe3+ transport system permease subunit
MDVSAANNSGNVGGMVCILVLLFGAPIYAFGYHRARMHRANKDYKSAKALVPGLRKGFWSAWWSAVKFGSVIALVVAALFLWMVRGGHNQADTTPSPSPSTSSHHR